MSSVAVVAMDIHKRFSKAVTFNTEGVGCPKSLSGFSEAACN